MLDRLRNLSVKNKLVLMQVFTSVFVLSLSFAINIFLSIKNYKERKVESVETIIEVISTTSISALQFLDSNAAALILTELKIKKDIINAGIFDKEGNVFATYSKTPESYQTPLDIRNKKEPQFIGHDLIICKDIINNNDVMGKICIRTELTELDALKMDLVWLSFLLLITGIAFAFFIALIIQGFLSRPLLNLISVTQKIKQSRDYKIRSIVENKDEIGILCNEFNSMLEEIEKKDIELEARVKKRTSELEMANKDLESFSYSIAHDMRAPVRAIHGFSTMLNKNYLDKLDEAGKELLNTVTAESLRLGNLIDDLLAFIRIRQTEFYKSPVDMTALAKDSMNDVLSFSEEKFNAKITIKDLPMAKGQQALLKQLFVCLISNALKFSAPKPDAAIEIGCYKNKEGSVYYVKDNGVGFDMKYYDKLFGVFQRLHRPQEFKGTGIGLAIAKWVITRHHGKIWAEGKLNEGATFYFSLPD